MELGRLPHTSLWLGVLLVVMATLWPGAWGMPQDQGCLPMDCIVSEWSEWSACSVTCGDLGGTRVRTRRKLQDAVCGGTCALAMSESEVCNKRCCPQDCEFTEWTAWKNCYCADNVCPQPGRWLVCERFRRLTKGSSCGGYCDDKLLETKCDQLCCYRDCVLGHWEFWSPCYAPCQQLGTQNRSREITQQAECGGTQCQQVAEERSCMGGCCPVDCVLGQWSEWSQCSATCGQANVTRTRFVQRESCGGKDCGEDPASTAFKLCEKYDNQDCKVSGWTEWTECLLDNGRCGAGKRNRTRTVMVESKCRGLPCPELVAVAECQGPCCLQDCVVGLWTKWGHCSTECGKGLSNRTREILTPAACGGTLCPDVLETMECEVTDTINCNFTSWTAWSACSTNCGKGTAVRTRVLLTPKYCGGICLDTKTEETQPCESYSAKRDCKVTAWTVWSACVKNCAEGVKTRNRTITQNPACGGLTCDGFPLVETQTCHPKCQQLCNQAKCSCNTGYKLKADGYSCENVTCPAAPVIAQYCPSDRILFQTCRPVSRTNCNETLNYGARCFGECVSSAWVVRGSPTKYIECQENGRWSTSNIFCGPINKAPLKVGVMNSMIPEGTQVNSCFTKLYTTTDNEPFDVHRYLLIQDPSASLFIKEGELCLKKQLNYEQVNLRNFTVTIRSTDLDGASVESNVTLEVINSNDPPRDAKLEPNVLRENSGLGTEVGCLSAVDDDPGQTLTYYLLNSDSGRFKIYDKDGQKCVKVAKESDPKCATEGGRLCQFDFESQPVHYITVLVSDNGDPVGSSYFDLPIRITDVNERVLGVHLQPPDVLEGNKAGDVVGQLVADDEDKGQKHRFELLSGDTADFEVRNGSVIAKRVLNREAEDNRQFTLRVRATDNGEPPFSTEANVVFGVADLNEPPSDLHLTSNNGRMAFDTDKPRIRENSNVIMIGTVTVQDPDKDDVITLTVEDPSNRLQLLDTRCSSISKEIHNYCTASLAATASFDHETEPTHAFTLKARDKYGVVTALPLTMTVVGTNDGPTGILLNGEDRSEFSVPENTRSFPVGTLTAVDQDVSDTHRFFLSGNGSYQFEIIGNKLQTLHAATLDFEREWRYTLTVTVSDSGSPPLTFSKTFTVNVTDVNEPPTNVTLSSSKVNENSAENTVVGLLSAADPDTTQHQTIHYFLLDDAKDRFKVEGNTLKVKASGEKCGAVACALNFEAEAEVSVRVQAQDDGTPTQSAEKVFTLSILDVNDAPTRLRLSASSVRENLPTGAIVGTVEADDEDVGDTLTFELLDGQDKFAVVNSQLVTSAALDFEQTPAVNVTIRATDSGKSRLSTQAVVRVTVLDANEAPVWTSSLLQKEVGEDVAVGTVVATVTVTDPDVQEALTLTLGESDVAAPFDVSQAKCSNQEGGRGTVCTAEVRVRRPLNFEEASSHSFTLKVSDKQGLSAVAKATVTVTNSNDPPKDILLGGVSVNSVEAEEGVAPLDLAVLRAVDEDSGQNHAFSIAAQQSDLFAVLGNTLKVLKPLDFEARSQHQLVLSVQDSGNPPLQYNKSITVVVRDANEPPHDLLLDNDRVAENSVEGTLVGRLIATDSDSSGSQTFTFTLIDSAQQRFKVSGNQLQVGPTAIDYETVAGHQVTLQVLVTDSGSPPRSAEFPLRVTVTDANDPPRRLMLSGDQVSELGVAGSLVGRLSVEDEDKGQSHTFSLTNDAQGHFRIDGNAVVKATGDKLTSSSYTITVKAVDSGSLPKEVEETFYINVENEEEAPQNLTLEVTPASTKDSSGVLHVRENVAANTSVATVTAVDADSNQQITFSLLSDSGGIFSVDSTSNCQSQGTGTRCTANVRVSRPVDYEASSGSLAVRIKATDSQGMATSQLFPVVVDDVNEPPTDIRFSGGDIRVKEDMRGDFLGKFSALDPDLGDTFTFTLVAGSGGSFVLTQDGRLSVTDEPTLDFERTSRLELQVNVTDRGNNNYGKKFTVTVEDVNEKPTSVSLSNSNVPELSAAGTEVGRLQTVDPDNEGAPGKQTFTYTLLSDADGRFVLDNAVLKVAADNRGCLDPKSTLPCLLDYERESHHVVTVRVQDSGQPPLTLTTPLTINVVDANDPPSPPTLQGTQVSEAATVGTEVGRLSATDGDLRQTLTFSLVNSSGAFRIEGQRLLLNRSLDFEEASSLTFTVKVTDSGTPPKESQQQFTVQVLDANEAPNSMSLEAVAEGAGALAFPTDRPRVGENLPPGTVVARLLVQDPDTQEQVSAHSPSPLVSLSPLSCLTLTKGTRCVGQLMLTQELDFETQPSFPVVIEVSDRLGLQMSRNFTFTVVNGNDKPTKLLVNGTEGKEVTVAEGTKDATVATLSAEDPDVGQNHSFSVQQGPSFLYIVGNQLKIRSTAQLDYETTSSYSVTLRVTDNGNPVQFLDSVINLVITDVNEPPTDVTITRNQVAEDSQAGTEVGELRATDPDNALALTQTLSFALIDNAGGRFQIDGNKVKVANPQFDYETARKLSIRVRVSDSGTPPKSAEFPLDLEVVDANDPPTNLRFSGSGVAEDAGVGTVVGRLGAEDADSGQTLAYSLQPNAFLTVQGDQVLVSGKLDFETAPSLTLVANVTDSGSPPLTARRNFTLEVRDVNEEPTRLEYVSLVAGGRLEVPEQARVGDRLATLTAADQDTPDLLSILLLEDGNGTVKLAKKVADCQKVSVNGSQETRCTVDVLLAKTVDFERTDKPLALSARAVDKGGLAISNSWRLSVVNANDPPTDILLSGRTALPESQGDVELGEMTCVDDDRDDRHSFQVLSHWDTFYVKLDKVLIARAPIDYENQTSYSVEIKCLDNGQPSLSFSKFFNISVQNVNERPSHIALSYDQVSMNAAVGDLVGHIQVRDPDNEGKAGQVQSHTCTVAPGDRFSIKPGTLALQVAADLPKTETMLMFNVTCQDDGTPPESLTRVLGVKVVVAADVPKSVALQGQNGVSENQANVSAGQLVVLNDLNKEPIIGTYSFSIESVEPAEGRLAFSLRNSELVVTSPLDFEKVREYVVKVKATGKDGRDQAVNVSSNVTVKVRDVNEPPTHIQIYNGALVAENSRPGTVIGDLNTIDPEPEQTYVYTLLAVSRGPQLAQPYVNDVFVLEGRTLKVGLNTGLLDYEAASVFTLQINTRDSGTPPLNYTGTLYISLSDVNDPPTNVSLSQDTVAENSAVGSVVGVLQLEDQDVNTSYSCSVRNLQQVPFQVVNGTKLVVAKGSLDYEQQRNLVVEVQCVDSHADGSSLEVSRNLLVSVTDVNEPPYDLALSSEKTEENNLAGKTIATIKATDPDSERVTFSVLEPAQQFSVEGDNTLVARTVLDFETAPLVPLVIVARDNQGLSSTATFTLTVLDKNEEPSAIRLSGQSVQENSAPGTLVGKLTTEDSDRDQTYTYSITDQGDKAYFAVTGDRLVVGEAGVDYESKASHNITIESRDSGSPSLSVRKTFNIEVTDVNERPLQIVTTALNDLPEDTPVQTVVANISVDDPENSQSLSCTVAPPSPFAVRTGSGGVKTLVLQTSLNFEDAPSLNVTLTCTDGQFPITKALQVRVTDVNEPPGQVKVEGQLVLPASNTTGHVIGTLSVQDPDVGQSHVFSVQGPFSDLVQVKRGNVLEVVSELPRSLLEQPNPTVTLTLRAVDSGQPSLSSQTSVSLPITHEDLSALRLPNITIDNQRLDETAAPGTVVGELYDVNAADAGADVTFTVSVQGWVGELFRVENKRKLVLAGSLSQVPGNSLVVLITATSHSTQETVQRNITIFITRSQVCFKNGRNCAEDARCVKYNASWEQCQCQDDFQGNGYTCTKNNHCLSSPCLNGGTCVDEINAFSCRCRKGFSGKTCDIEEATSTPCSSGPCRNGGGCSAEPGALNYTCTCTAGWTGVHCDVSVDDCLEAVCNNGTCQDRHRTYVCLCPPELQGEHCQYLTTACQSSPCSQASVCVPRPGLNASDCVASSYRVNFTLRISDVTDRDAVRMRVVEFMTRYGRFAARPASTNASLASSGRRRRDAEAVNVRVYAERVEEVSSGQYRLLLVVMDASDHPYSKEEVLAALKRTCDSLESSGNSEELVCPAVKEELAKMNPATRPSLPSPPSAPSPSSPFNSGGRPYPFTTGGAGGIVVMTTLLLLIQTLLARG